ncbi:hypothetical protein AALP_AAs57597U000300 [Arabis alpina]|uniref:Uncharacterized protein n=1 Tax=Arabis alpina TaxID=50452 RepID=A0A087FX97_ARAAL|nr:hypothetical protein AALP_AAs57597U000300 [Arabis alpina]
MPLSISSHSFFSISEHDHCSKLVSTSVDLFALPLQNVLRKSFSLQNHKAHTTVIIGAKPKWSGLQNLKKTLKSEWRPSFTCDHSLRI